MLVDNFKCFILEIAFPDFEDFILALINRYNNNKLLKFQRKKRTQVHLAIFLYLINKIIFKKRERGKQRKREIEKITLMPDF